MQECQLAMNNELWGKRSSGNKERLSENFSGRNMLHFGAEGNYEDVKLAT